MFVAAFSSHAVSANGADETLLFFDDFSQSTIGAYPEGWGREANQGYVEVVEVDGLASGRALLVKGDPKRKETRVWAYLWDPPASDTVTLVLEHQVYYVSGIGGINLYLFKKHYDYNVHWSIHAGGELRYRYSRNELVGKLKDGWNRIRIIANREKNEVYVFLNDMETPVIGPAPFRLPIESWTGARILIQHTYSEQHEEMSEVLYGDFKVWRIDGVEDQYIPSDS